MRQCGLSNVNILEIILEGCTSMKGLAIEGDYLGSEGAPLIANFIRGNHPLEMLGLGCTNISDNDTLILASALKENTNLYWMELRENNDITEEGEKNLLNVVFDPNMPTQLEKDALSRLFHTLRGWELPMLFENLNKPSTNGGKKKRRKTRR